jgi:ribosome-associated translation inhibitor RaiA
MQLAPQATGLENSSIELREEQALFYTAKDDVIAVLKKQIEQYQSALAEKDKIIRLLENRQPLRR